MTKYFFRHIFQLTTWICFEWNNWIKLHEMSTKLFRSGNSLMYYFYENLFFKWFFVAIWYSNYCSSTIIWCSTSITTFVWKRSYKHFLLPNFFFLQSDESVTLTDFVTIKIHFKDITCLKYRRDVFLTWDSMFGK